MKAETWLLLGVAVYFLYERGFFGSSVPQPVFQVCKYPDGTGILVPVGNQCPTDPLHGGRAIPCGAPFPPC